MQTSVNQKCLFACLVVFVNLLETDKIPESYKIDYIFYKVFNNLISAEELKNYLMKIDGDLNSNYKKLLCLYDFKEYENL